MVQYIEVYTGINFLHLLSPSEYHTSQRSVPSIRSLQSARQSSWGGKNVCVSQKKKRGRRKFRSDIPVEIVEKGEQIECKLEQGLFFVPRNRPEYLRSIIHVVFVHYSEATSICIRQCAGEMHVLIRIEG